MGIQRCGGEMEISGFPQCNEDFQNASCRVLHIWCISQQHLQLSLLDKAQQYFGAVQLMLDEYLNLIVEQKSDKTQTTSDNDVCYAN